MDFAIEEFGGLHIMFNNAGISGAQHDRFLDDDFSDFDKVVGINLFGVIKGSQTARHGVVLCAGALIAELNAGATTEHTEAGWWIPIMYMPMPKASNFEEIHQAAFDVGRPHSVCVNRNAECFVDEACSGTRDYRARTLRSRNLVNH